MSSFLTDTIAESAGVPQVGEELAATHVVEQHVDTGVVVRPPPPAKQRGVKTLPLDDPVTNISLTTLPKNNALTEKNNTTIFFYVGDLRMTFLWICSLPVLIDS